MKDLSLPLREFAIKHWLLLVILLAGLLVRLGWMLTRTEVLENDGAEYVRLAESLLNGNGYRGTMEGMQGFQLWYGPLYPICIAGVSLVLRDLELAARVSALLWGTTLAIPMYLLASSIYGQKTALTCACLVAFHPVLIGYSAAAYNENTYLPLVVFGIYWGLRSLKGERLTHSGLAGLSFGLAYLSRVEAIIYPFALGLFALVARRKHWKSALLSLLLCVGVFSLVAAPYVAFLSFDTGKFRVEAKNLLNYTVARRAELGMPYNQAAWGINQDLQEEGPLLNPRLYASYSPFSMQISDLAAYFLRAAQRNLKPLVGNLIFFGGTPLPLALVLIGWFRKSWDLPRLLHEGFLAFWALLIAVPLLGAHLLQSRYLLALLPLLVLWTAKGITELGLWAAESFAFMNAVAVDKITRVTLCMAVVAGAARHVPYLSDLTQGGLEYRTVKEAGLWLKRNYPGPKRIMDTSSAVMAFYSDGTWWSLPYADSRVALSYIERKNPDFIVLSGGAIGLRPYLRDWVESGIPHPRAKLIYSKGEPQERKVQIYRWGLVSEGLVGQRAKSEVGGKVNNRK